MPDAIEPDFVYHAGSIGHYVNSSLLRVRGSVGVTPGGACWTRQPSLQLCLLLFLFSHHRAAQSGT